MSLPEYLPTDLPQYVKLNSRAEFSSSVVSSGHVLLFAEEGSSGTSLVAKNQDGTYTDIAGGGIITSDGNITSGTVLSGYIGYNSSGRVEGAIPSVGSSSYVVGSSGLTLSGGVYLSGNQSFTMDSSGIIEVSSTTAEAGDVLSGKVFFDSAGTLTFGTLTVSSGGGVEVGYVASVVSGSALFQPIAFSGGTTAYNDGSAVYVSASGTYNLPEPVESGVKVYSSGVLVSSAASVSGISITSGGSADTVVVYDGGSAGIQVISSGGHLFVMSGGSALVSSIKVGAHVDYTYGGIVAYTAAAASDTILLWSSGALVSETSSLDFTTISAPLEAEAFGSCTFLTVTVESGGRITIRPDLGSSGAVADVMAITIGNGGRVIVSDTSIQADGSVLSGGTLSVIGTATIAPNQSISAYGGTVIIESDAVIEGFEGILEAASGGSVITSAGGEYAILQAMSGGTVDLYGASVYMGYANPGGHMTLHSGAVINSGLVFSGGTLTVSSGAAAYNVTSETGAVVHSAAGAVITYA